MIDLYLEGMDLSGKSTIANSLAESPGDVHYAVQRSRLTKINPIYDFASGFNKSRAGLSDGLENVVSHLFLASLLYDLKNYQEDGRNIIQDSASIARGIAFNAAQNNRAVCDELYNMLKLFPRPKKSVYLYATIDDRLKRLADRLKNQPQQIAPADFLVKNDVARFKQMEETLRAVACEYFNATVINTSEKSVPAVVAEIKSML